MILIEPQITLTGSGTMSTIAANSAGAAISLQNVLADNLQTLVLLSGTSSIDVGSLGSSSYPIGAVSLTGDAIRLNGPVTAAGSNGSLSISNSGDLHIESGDVALSGSFLQQGIGDVFLGNNITADGGLFLFNLLYN